jgi:hypothetical protein
MKCFREYMVHDDGGLEEMEPETLIPSRSQSFKSESLTQMKRTYLSTFTHAYIWESGAIVMISLKGFYTCNKLIGHYLKHKGHKRILHTYRGKWSSKFTVDREWNLLSSVITACQGVFVFPVSQSRYCVDCKIKILRCCQSLGPSDVGFAAWAAVIFLGCSSHTTEYRVYFGENCIVLKS